MLLALVCCTAGAQDPSCTIVLQGRVIDEHDRSPLSFAEIFLPDQGVGAVADETGAYVLEGLCPGRYLVRVMHLGCEPVEQVIDLRRNMVMDFELEHHLEELRELEVIRQRPDENVGQARMEVDRSALDRSTQHDVATMLSTIPGVNMLRTGPTINKPVIHGLYGDRILMLNNGVRQQDQQWGTEHAPNMDPFAAERYTVVKGAAAVQYGSDAMGGVVLAEPPALPRTKGTRGEVRISAGSNGRGGGLGGMLEGGSGKVRGLGWRLQASGRRFGDAHAADHVLSNTGLREMAASASIGVQGPRTGASFYYSAFARELGILRAAHIGNLTDLQEAITRQQPWYVAPFTYAIEAPRQEVVHHLLKAELSRRITMRDQLVLTYAYQTNDRQEYDRRRGALRERPALDLYLRSHTADLVLKHWLGERLHGKIGVNGLYQENVNIPGTGIQPLIPNHVRLVTGAFIHEHYPVTGTLELEAGARLEQAQLDVYKFDDDGQWISPRHVFTNNAFSIGANWGTDSLRLRANISSAYRPPNVNELYSEGLHHGAAALEYGDPTLGNERSLKMVADLTGHAIGGKMAFSFTVYRDRIDNYIYLRPAGQVLTIRGAFPRFDHVSTDALLNGADAMVEIRVRKAWSIGARASYLHGHDLQENRPLFLMPSNRIQASLVHEIPAAGPWRELRFEINGTFVMRQRRVPDGVDFMDAPPGYQLLGAAITMARPVGRNEIRLGLAGSNLLNVAYRDLLDRSRYFADARGADVTLWLRYTFGRKEH